MIKRTAAIVATATLLSTGVASALPTHAARTDRPVPKWVTISCQQEDSVYCHWDAGRSGNHRGHSFMVRQFPGKAKMVCVMYVDRKFAAKHDYCESTR
jgi:hypothetical protein